jgi:hypothetical protein
MIYTTEKAIEILEAFKAGKTVRWSMKGFKHWSKIAEIGQFRHQWDFKNNDYKVEKQKK